MALLAGALALGAAHADDHRLDAPDGCAVCRHVRATPLVVHDAIAIAPLWLQWSALPPAVPATRVARSRRARARSPPPIA